MRNPFEIGLAAIACVVFIVGCGSGVETKGEGSVYKAAEAGDLGTITAAMQKGFQANTPDENGMTILHHAAQAGQAEVIELLTADFGASATVKDKEGRTPLDLAQQNGDAQAIELLTQAAGES